MGEVERIAKGLPSKVVRAVLACPFNSKGCGVPGGALAPYNAGNGNMGNVALFNREQQRDYSGNYTLTTLGLAVRDYLLRNPDA